MSTPLLRWLPLAVAKVPATLRTKLLVAFLAIVGLLLAIGAVSLAELGRLNQRAEDFVKLQRKIAAYRQIQHSTTSQLYSVATAMLAPDASALDATLRQLNQFGYDLDRLQFVAQDEVELLQRVRVEYEGFTAAVSEVIELIRAGKVNEGRSAQVERAGPLAERLERLTNELVNQAEADMVARIDESHDGYLASLRWVVGLRPGQHRPRARLGLLDLVVADRAVASDGRALRPDRRRRLYEAVDGAQPRRARHAGRQPEPHERRARTTVRTDRGGEPAQVGVPGQHVARAAHAAECDHRLLGSAAGARCSAS